MKVIITAGGTRCPIDSVRYIGNNSKGKTGALLADYFIGKGDDVSYIHGKDAHRPNGKCHIIEITTPDEYKDRLLQAADTADVAILTMAVSDYAPVARTGKIRSDKPSLTLELYPTPKVIHILREAYPHLFIVGCKLLTEDYSQVDLIRAGYDMMLANKLNLCVVNRVSNAFKVLNTGILTPEKNLQPVKREDLPQVLHDRIQQRFSKSYFKTNHLGIKRKKPPESLLLIMQKLNALGLFPKYQPEKSNSPSFGFVAYKQNATIWITGRGSRKDLDSFVNIEEIKGNNINVRGQTKATLNSYVATALFDKFPNRSLCIHFHHKLSDPNIIELGESTPGTLQDFQSVQDALTTAKDNTIGVYQKFHGTTLCINTITELETLLLNHNCYNKSAELYDQSYYRFNNDHLLDSLSANTNKDAIIWDVAGGTGSLSAQLLENGFTNITIIDQSSPMLREAAKKLGDKAKYIQHRMQDISIAEPRPDVICIRQAINYLPQSELKSTIRQLLSVLAKGGKLYINTFINPKMNDKNLDNGTVEVHEKNQLSDGIITHGQYATNWSTGDTHFDLNKFFNISKAEWEDTLKGLAFKWTEHKSSVLIEVLQT